MLKTQEYREVFHFFFLEQLLRISDPGLYVLKGGVNLRFFFRSPRYSEDMDLDVKGANVETLKKNGYKILRNSSFQRVLNTYGIESLEINDPEKAKQTETTQRFKVGLVLSNGDRLPTKIEFSRRTATRSKDTKIDPAIETNSIEPEIARRYQRRSFPCRHYSGKQAVLQKIVALAKRPTTQARDVFDLHILALGGYTKNLTPNVEVPAEVIEIALNNTLSLGWEEFRGQVLEFLEAPYVETYNQKRHWQELQKKTVLFLKGEGHGI